MKKTNQNILVHCAAVLCSVVLLASIPLRSFIRFDTTDLPTNFVSNSLLTATLDGELMQNVGTYAVTVVNPGSGGSPSNAAYFIVNFPLD